MEHVKVEFDWKSPSIKENYSHTQSEWGKDFTKDKDITVICVYKMRWENN